MHPKSFEEFSSLQMGSIILGSRLKPKMPKIFS